MPGQFGFLIPITPTEMPRNPEVVYYSRYMLALQTKLAEGRNPNTVDLILRTLRKLCGERFTSLQALSTFPTLVGKPSYVAAGLKHCYVALRAIDDPLWEAYHERYKTAADALNAETNTHTATEQQEKNWITMDSLHALLASLEPRIADLAFKEALGTAVLALFTLIPARRAGDYFALHIQHEGPPVDHSNTYNPHTRILTLTNYKTADRYGTYAIHIPDRLADILDAVIARHPHRESNYYRFIVKEDGTPYTSCNCIQFLLHAVGAKTTPTGIRHALISETFPTLPEQHQQRTQLATAMAHSTETQRTYIRRIGTHSE
jgi:hypothetical protein